MDLSGTLFAPPVLIGAWLAFAASIVLAARPGARESFTARASGHAFPLALAVVLLIWQIRALTPSGPALHLLGATLLTLLFGYRLALIGLAAVLALHTAHGAGDWWGYGLNGVLSVLVPVLVSHALATTVRRRRPNRPFPLILVSGFAGGALAMTAAVLASTAVLLSLSSTGWLRTLEMYGASGLLMIFPEAFVTGALIAWLAMFYPRVVEGFDPNAGVAAADAPVRHERR